METKRDATENENKNRFANKEDERLSPNTGYGAGNHDHTRPKPSTMPSSPQTDKAKPIVVDPR